MFLILGWAHNQNISYHIKPGIAEILLISVKYRALFRKIMTSGLRPFRYLSTSARLLSRRRNECTECGGASICPHQRRRSECKECGGASICPHQRQRNKCKECGGAGICPHQRIRSRCKECREEADGSCRTGWRSSEKARIAPHVVEVNSTRPADGTQWSSTCGSGSLNRPKGRCLHSAPGERNAVRKAGAGGRQRGGNASTQGRPAHPRGPACTTSSAGSAARGGGARVQRFAIGLRRGRGVAGA